MLVAVLDVGSNTVRLLVAEVSRDGVIEPVAKDKAYLGLGAEIARTGSLRPEAIGAAAGVCRRFADQARADGSERGEVIVTAPGRQGKGAAALVAALRGATRLPVRVLTAEEEGTLAFDGAVARATELPASVGMVDVGGGSTEIVVGRRRSGARWIGSVDLGSLRLARLALDADPPSKRDLQAARDAVQSAFAPLSPPRPEVALAVGGSARALAKLVGRTFDADAAETAIARLARRRSVKVARAAGIDERRAETLLAGALLLAESSRALGRPLTLARGGLREGAALALAREGAAAAA
jgi:exopolyphosphatase/guanosine-5'-triphosphate,3'-diphosphate pyrophosphatase